MKISTAFSTPAFPSFISSSRRRPRGRRTTTTKSSSFDDDADACYNLDELFDDDRPSNRKTLFDMSKKAQKKTKDESETMMMSVSSSTRRSLEVEVPSVMKSKAAILAEEMYEDSEEERMNEDKEEEYLEEESDLMRKVVKGVDGILDGVEKETRQNFLVKGTWETFKRGERIANNPSVQKGAKIVQKVSVETVKVATPIVAKAAATGIKEGGKLAFKVALGAKNMGDERRQKKQAKKIVEKKSNGVTPTWKKNEGVFKSGKVPFSSSFGRRNEKEEEEEEEEEENVFKSLFGGGKKKEQPPPPPTKKRTDIFGRERE